VGWKIYVCETLRIFDYLANPLIGYVNNFCPQPKERYPFKPKPLTGLATGKEVTPERRRAMIKQRLRMNMKVNVVEIAFMRDNPHQVQWLLESVDPILRPNIHLLVGPESSADVQKEV
jgi:hypothetical protein